MRLFDIFLRSIALACYHISRLIPRKKSRWLFGGATGFNNNSKYFFLDVVENHPEIEAVWIGDHKSTEVVRRIGLKAYYRFSLKGIWLCLTSKYYIVDHTQGCIDFWTSGGAKIINLWHGVGWKACLWCNPSHSVYKNKGFWANYCHMLYYPHLYYKPDLLLSSSPYMTEHFFAPMFEVPYEKCVEDDYPRCKFMLKGRDYIVNHINKIGAVENLHLIEKARKYKKTILYAPTFRDAQYDFITESGIDFDDLNEFLKERNWFFMVKCHPSTHINLDLKIDRTNILMLDKYVDSYYIMPFVQILISDYSSIVFDFMRLYRPIILFPFDKKLYNNGSRTFQIDYDELVESIPQVYSYVELKAQLKIVDKQQIVFNEKLWKPSSRLIETIYRL